MSAATDLTVAREWLAEHGRHRPASRWDAYAPDCDYSTSPDRARDRRLPTTPAGAVAVAVDSPTMADVYAYPALRALVDAAIGPHARVIDLCTWADDASMRDVLRVFDRAIKAAS